MTSSVEGWMVSPRKSRRKSACFSSTMTSTPARASRKPSMRPHGPPPTMAHRVESCWAAILCTLRDGSADARRECTAFALDPDHSLRDDVAGEQERAKGDDHHRGAGFDAAHRQHPVAGTTVGEALRPSLGADGKGRDDRDRDGGAKSHDEGRCDTRPEQSLRQRKDQHQDCAGTRPQSDRDDRSEAALPSAGPGELVGFRRMRVPPCRRVAVMRVIMVMITMVMMVMMTVTMMMIMAVMAAIAVLHRRRRGAQGGGAMERLRGPDEGAALHPQQSHADKDNERIAENLDHVDRAPHGGCGCV